MYMTFCQCPRCIHDKVIKYWFRPIEFACNKINKAESALQTPLSRDGKRYCLHYEPTEQTRIENKGW